MKKEKPLSLKIASRTRLHVSKDFVTNGHFALKPALFHVLNLKVRLSETPVSFDVAGNGALGQELISPLNVEQVERVFALADSAEYQTEKPMLRTSDNVTVKVTSGQVAAHISPKYLPLLDRLDRIVGGEWQINSELSNLKALRFVLNGKTQALLMPCTGKKT